MALDDLSAGTTSDDVRTDVRPRPAGPSLARVAGDVFGASGTSDDEVAVFDSATPGVLLRRALELYEKAS